ncbi:hypothetical protein FOA52_004533 [Chlamydomonas sp. UWO 241]|nr:hypothetical protein FOA52_004533 [Chlamydomonas sp. UWO 241]
MGTVVFRALVTEAQAVAAGFTEGSNVAYMGDEVRVIFFRIGGGMMSLACSMQTSYMESVGIDPAQLLADSGDHGGSSADWARASKLSGAAAQSALLAATAGWDPSFTAVVAATAPEGWIAHGTFARPSAELTPACFGRGRVVVVGDAAHPIRPTGQGANQALEDAYFLGAAVGADPIGMSGLDAFRRARAERVAPVMLESEVQGAAAYD